MLIRLLIATLFFSYSINTTANTNTASLYADAAQSVYQIRVINKETGKKSSIGSGFVVAKNNILATNYHVVSQYVNNPDVYVLEYLSNTKETGKLELLDLDIVHDLAVVKAPKAMGKVLDIDAIPEKGARLFSLGNPLDLGFSIVAGTNNGILKQDEDGNIHFSGSLNAGMSGGPTLNEAGKVIGVNVATAGNNISFLVPADYLKIVLERLQKNNYSPIKDRFAHSSAQIRTSANKILNKLANNNWGQASIGHFIVPAELDKSVRCWDASRQPKKEDLFRSFYTRCSNEDDIYLSDQLSMGSINYEYLWLDSNKLNPARFYRRYEKVNSSALASHAGKRDVTNFACHTAFTKIAQQNFKTTLCRRDYIKYKNLSDILFTTALVSHGDKGFIFNMDITGTDANAATRLFQKMLEAFKWRK
ncbi:MAG: trypsin-like peptidase domain-containing protein [Cocleimonas sp.]|nr:trypsin-like peptidase domain-containing protein [Cocleimonas sp.]